MKKLKLDAESLRVEPFDVMPQDATGKGTVVAAGITLRCEPSAGGSCDTGIPICVYCRAF
ncbi:MAG: hypothetical protein JO306_07265 [Gemmatimonadetes bacterium]|nr:hypothetical protein [Gemmatimonadota bacterium]